MDANSIIEFLGGIPLLQRLPSSSLKKIAQAVKIAHFDRGQYIIREPEHGDGVYFIWNGEAFVYGHSEEGRGTEVLLKRSDCFGNGAPVSDQQADVIAASKLTCLVLPHERCSLLQSKSIWNSDERHGTCSSMENILHVDPVEVNLFRGITLPEAPRGIRLFGGQFIGQALAAASKTVGLFKIVHHSQAYFLLGGDLDVPVTYEVHRIHEGKSFAYRKVNAMQKGKVVFMLLASFQKQENGFEHQEAVMPSVPSPDTLLPMEEMLERRIITLSSPLLMAYRKNPRVNNNKLPMKDFDPWPIEIRLCEPNISANPSTSAPSLRYWFRAKGELSDDPALHRCVVAYASDLIFIQVGLPPHHGKGSKINMYSLNHTMWFHRPVKADDWLLFVVKSPSAYGARVLCVGQMFNMKGELVTSVSQEGVIRTLRTPKQAIQAKY
ncbi:hypothetical protein Ancab_037032 [Ancistrocladus abbreviatus]